MATEAEYASTPLTTRPNDPTAEPSIGDLVRDATTHLSTVVRGEIELAKLEIGASVRRFGLGAAIFSAAATVLFFSLFFPFIALAEGLVSLGLPRWGAYLVVWGVMLVLTGVLVLVGIRLMKRIQKPERTIETVRDTARLAMHPTGSGAAGETSAAPSAATGTTSDPKSDSKSNGKSDSGSDTVSDATDSGTDAPRDTARADDRPNDDADGPTDPSGPPRR